MKYVVFRLAQKPGSGTDPSIHTRLRVRDPFTGNQNCSEWHSSGSEDWNVKLYVSIPDNANDFSRLEVYLESYLEDCTYGEAWRIVGMGTSHYPSGYTGEGTC